VTTTTPEAVKKAAEAGTPKADPKAKPSQVVYLV
jgi:hypothetical protein